MKLLFLLLLLRLLLLLWLIMITTWFCVYCICFNTNEKKTIILCLVLWWLFLLAGLNNLFWQTRTYDRWTMNKTMCVWVRFQAIYYYIFIRFMFLIWYLLRVVGSCVKFVWSLFGSFFLYSSFGAKWIRIWLKIHTTYYEMHVTWHNLTNNAINDVRCMQRRKQKFETQKW